ncbi:sulfatase [Rhodopirellula sp. JC639]|uniref:sulfatase n=1 Tax=Stieleria mannarensis TaxID=2755585 RepID=UPI00160107A3|nr:sulfatase [Rhodopirellula sp. JC639]
MIGQFDALRPLSPWTPSGLNASARSRIRHRRRIFSHPLTCRGAVLPILLGTMIATLFLSQAAFGNDRPNIVLFFVDDLGWNNLGYRNPDLFGTPNIDRLAKEGMDFHQCYVASPTCSPSRATLLTGKHPVRLKIVRHIPVGPKHPDFDEFGRTDVEFNLWETDPAQFPCRNWLPLDEVTYAEALRDEGYYNLFVGKWHLGHEPYHPIHQGFDKQIGTSNYGHPKGYYPPFTAHGEVFPEAREDEYLTDKLTDQTVAFVQSYQRDQPFMISLWYYNVHSPNIGRKDLKQKTAGKAGLEGKLADYAAQVAAVDESVGRVLDAIKQRGIEDNTLILFTSDQGSLFEWAPYRGCKRSDTLCEGGARVPLIVRWPGVVTPGCTNDSVVQTTDLFPTLVEVAGGDPESFEDLDGVSLLPVLKSNQNLDRGEPIFGYRAYEDQYVSVREGDWKLIGYRSGKLSLYNVAQDRSEQQSLVERHPAKAKTLVEKLKRWETEMGVDPYSGFATSAR